MFDEEKVMSGTLSVYSVLRPSQHATHSCLFSVTKAFCVEGAISVLQAHYLEIWLPGCCWQQASALFCKLAA